MDQREALAALQAGDHAIFTVEHGKKIAEAFGLVVEPSTFTDSRSKHKGITLKDCKEGETDQGYDAAHLAMRICDGLKLEYTEKFGSGSQLRACCFVINRHLNA